MRIFRRAQTKGSDALRSIEGSTDAPKLIRTNSNMIRHSSRGWPHRSSWFPRPLLAAVALQGGFSIGGEIVSAAPPAGNVAAPDRAGDRLSPAVFHAPPLNARPGSFWDWLNGSITREQITRDWEAMKAGGMRGGEIWDVAAAADPDGRVPAGPAFLGPESTQLIVHAIREADRLGLEIGIVASSGWNAGGSWVTPEHAGKGLYHSTTAVTGPTGFHDARPLPELPENCPRDEQGRPSYLREVAVLADKTSIK